MIEDTSDAVMKLGGSSSYRDTHPGGEIGFSVQGERDPLEHPEQPTRRLKCKGHLRRVEISNPWREYSRVQQYLRCH